MRQGAKLPHEMANSIVKFYDAAERPPRGGWNLVLGGRSYNANSESGVVDQVRDFQINNGSYLDDDTIREELWRHWCAREPERCCQPSAGAQGYVFETAVSSDGSQPASWKESQGAKKWAELHYFAAAVYKSGTIDSMAVRRWLVTFHRSIGCEDCRNTWALEQALLPPALNTGQAFFEWTVAAHNSVNGRIGKPQFPLAEAYNLYTV